MTKILSQLSRQALQILGVSLVLLVVLWGFVGMTIKENRETALRDAQSKNLNLALAHQQKAHSALRLLDQTLLMLRDDFARAREPIDIAQRLNVIHQAGGFVGIVSIIGPDGQPIVTNNKNNVLNYADREYFKFHALEPKDVLLVGKPILGKLSGEWRISLTRRLYKPDGGFGGVIFMALDPTFFATQTDLNDLGENSAIALIGLDGITRVRRNSSKVSYGEDVRASQLFKQIPNALSGSYVGKAASDGALRAVSYSVMPDYPMVVIVGSSVSDVLLKLRSNENQMLLMSVLGSLMVIALAFVLISRSVEAQRSLERVVHSEARLQAIIDISPVPMGLNRSGRDITFLNAAFSRTFGYTLDDVPTFDAWYELAYPDPQYRSWVRSMWHEGLKDAKLQNRSFGPLELKMRCKDGTDKFALASGASLSDVHQGEYLTVFYDITEKATTAKALESALKDKVGLLNEVHHRVKNNLQVITSLLRLEASRSTHGEVRSVLQDMQDRIRSMSLLHESLYRSGQFSHINLAVYLSQLASQGMRAMARDGSSVRLRTDLSPLDVSLDLAAPMGLLMNELLSNCLKHGFPPGAQGEIHVSLGPLEGSPVTWLFSVRDTGAGLPADMESRRGQSLGLQLVFDLATQIGGKADLRAAEGGGALFTLSFVPAVSPPEGSIT